MKKKLISVLSLCLAVCGLFCLISCSGGGQTSETAAPGSDGSSVGESGENIMIQIEMENGGIIKAELYPDKAPITVENFVSLANEGFYDGLIFHRVIKNFMIQGGDPDGNGTGGSGKNIKGEFSANGVTTNDISHVRGVLSMARSKNMDSASSQFFIVQADSTYLDGQYAAFGMVTEGMDVVDEIASVETDKYDKPVEDVVIKSIRVID